MCTLWNKAWLYFQKCTIASLHQCILFSKHYEYYNLCLQVQLGTEGTVIWKFISEGESSVLPANPRPAAYHWTQSRRLGGVEYCWLLPICKSFAWLRTSCGLKISPNWLTTSADRLQTGIEGLCGGQAKITMSRHEVGLTGGNAATERHDG